MLLIVSVNKRLLYNTIHKNRDIAKVWVRNQGIFWENFRTAQSLPFSPSHPFLSPFPPFPLLSSPLLPYTSHPSYAMRWPCHCIECQLYVISPTLSNILYSTKPHFRLRPCPEVLFFHVFWQEAKFIKYTDGLRNMLSNYHRVLSSLDNAEVGDTSSELWHNRLVEYLCSRHRMYIFFVTDIKYSTTIFADMVRGGRGRENKYCVAGK